MIEEIGRVIMDDNLSERSKLIMIYIYTMPDNFRIKKDQFSLIFKKTGRTIQKNFSELIEAGYIRYENYQDKNGDWAGGRYHLLPRDREKLRTKKNTV